MTAPHFFAPDVSGERVTIEGDDARHALRALRLRAGERVTISDGTGNVAEAIVEGDRDRLVARVTTRRDEPRPRPALHVFQAIPKKGKLDLVVQKLTEIGVDGIHLFPSERSVPRWDDAKAGAHAARLAQIARQAAMQSRRAWLPSVSPPRRPGALDLPEVSVVLDAGAGSRLGDALPAEPPAAIGIVVGAEGGLGEDELAAFRSRGAVPVSLGRPILRTETAALVAAVVVLARYGVLG